MTKDVVTYTNHLGFTIDLNDPNTEGRLLCDVIDLRPFTYTTDKGGTVAGSKEFELTVISRSTIFANLAIDYLMSDAYESKYGILRVNNWYLRCRALGVNSVDTEANVNNGLYKFIVKFEAPSMLWANKTYYKYNVTNNLFYARNGSNTGWDTHGMQHLAIQDVGGRANAVSMSCISPFYGDTGGHIKGNFSFDFRDLNDAGTQIGIETYKINFDDYTAIKSDFLTKQIVYASGASQGESVIGSVPDDSNWFACHPYSAISYLENIQGTVSGNIYFIVHKLRGMPEWL